MIIVSLLAFSMISQAASKPKRAKTNIRAWTLPAYIQCADTQKVDTFYLNLPQKTVIESYSISSAWNGGLISPIESRIYFDRLNKIDDIFGQQYQPYIITPEDVRFYNTTIPYSKLGYQHGFTTYHEEHELDFLFTGNLNKRLNLGLQLNYQSAAGHYAYQESKLFNGAVFGSYNGKHYFIHAAATWNMLSNFENGGICNKNDLDGTLEPEDIPVRMHGMSGYRYISGMLYHGYTSKALTISHTFQTVNSVRRYRERDSINASYFPNAYRNAHITRDSTNVLTISNTVAVTFEESFNKLLRFGITAYARNECQRYGYEKKEYYYPPLSLSGNTLAAIDRYGTHEMADTLMGYKWLNNTFVGGSIHKRQGKWFRYDAGGEVCVVGYKIGQFRVDGNIYANIPIAKDTMSIHAQVTFRNEKPSWYYEHYMSNHYRWENKFDKVYHFYAGGTIKYPTKWVKPAVRIGFDNITNLIYFKAEDGLPYQRGGNAQVFMADVKLDLTTPWINLENNVVFQTASKEIPVPMFTLYHNLYYHGTWFKALDAQIGADLRYFTRYHSPILNPSTGQFCVQDQVEIGNYPMLSVYANFFVRLLHLHFYAQYTHINHLFMKTNTDYLAMPLYPMNPDVFKIGILWHFFR